MLIPSKLLGLAGCAATFEHHRFGATQGVLLERDSGGTARAVATDGRIMAVAEWNEPEVPQEKRVSGWKAVVPAKLWRLCCRRAQWAQRDANGHWQAVETAAALTAPPEEVGRVTLVLPGLKIDAAQQPGLFPVWRRVWGPWRGGVTASGPGPAVPEGAYASALLGAGMLAQVCELARSLGADQLRVDVPAKFGGASSPLRFLADADAHGITVRGLLVPLVLCDGERNEILKEGAEDGDLPARA